ncbi:unnamed protein product [Ilex paraguariensis]|uniref:peroxidase n=1 Tax=Ilex paraguariensis TaxID=185542 RepID=A0ABC8U3Y4_9AQUA
MEASAKIVAAIFILCSIFPPLASSFFIFPNIFGLRGGIFNMPPVYDPRFQTPKDEPMHETPEYDEGHHTRNKGGRVQKSPKQDHDQDWNRGERVKKSPKNDHNQDRSGGGRVKKSPNNGIQGGSIREIPKDDGPENNQGGLRVGFYDQTCPRAEEIVKEVLSMAVQNNSGVPAGILRLHFHDCFVKGCDASLLLDQIPSLEQVEKLAVENTDSLVGFEVIDMVKAQLEQECPGVVSCADILAFGARDSLVLSGLQNYDVAGGRRDSLTSRKVDVNGSLPHPNWPLDQMAQNFLNKGLTIEDMVVLTGAHSIGVAHCPTFSYRASAPDADKVMDANLLGYVRFTCGAENSKAYVAFDSVTSYNMDVEFYKQILNKKALLESDNAIANDPKTSYLVKSLALDQDGWSQKFVKSMTRMGRIEVLTGTQGEIRKQCRFVN